MRYLIALLTTSYAFANSIVVDDTQYLGEGCPGDNYEITSTGLLISNEEEGYIGTIDGEGELFIPNQNMVVIGDYIGGSYSTFDGAISGTGHVVIPEGCQLTLNGASTLTGSYSTISHSRLNLNSDNAGSDAIYALGNDSEMRINANVGIGGIRNGQGYNPSYPKSQVIIADGKTLYFGSNNEDLAFGGKFIGNGSLNKQGTGESDLREGTIANSVITISNGTLLTKATTFTALVPSITIEENGLLNLEIDTEEEWIGDPLRGKGSIIKSGSGPLTINSPIEIEGDFMIVEGDVIDASGSLASCNCLLISSGSTYIPSVPTTIPNLLGSGNIEANELVTLHSGADTTYHGQVSGDAHIQLTGGSTLTQTGTWTNTGNIRILDGILDVQGDLTSQALLTVEREARLIGKGTVGTADIFGAVKPGNSIGTLHVEGDYTHKSGSTLIVEVNGNGENSKVIVNGNAQIEPGATLSIIPVGETPLEKGKTYNFIQATDIEGDFSNLSFQSSDTLGDRFYTLSIPNTLAGPEQFQITLGARKPTQADSSIITMTSDLSKQAYSTQMDNLESWINVDMRNRTNCNPYHIVTPFLMYDYRGGGYRQHKGNTANRFGLNSATAGLQLNLVDHIAFGAGYGFTKSSFKANPSTSRLTADSNSILAFFNYGCFYNLQFDSQFAHTFTNFRSRRADIFDQHSTAKFNGQETAAQLRATYSANLAKFDLFPSLKVRYAYSSVDTYREEGDEDGRLSVDKDHMNQLYASIGLEASRRYGWVRPHIGFYYTYQFLNDERQVSTSYNQFEESANIAIAETGQNFAEFNFGIDLGKENVKTFAEFTGFFGTHQNFIYDCKLGISASF